MSCTATAACKAFNFCGATDCELLSDDIFTHGTNLTSEATCFYVGMKENTIPDCLEKSQLKNITDDLEPGFCRINSKRLDPEWGPWLPHHVENSTYWNVGTIRSCHTGAHLYVKECSEAITEIVEERFEFMLSPKSFFNAVDDCKSRGGQLYGDLDTLSLRVSFTNCD